MGKSSRHQSQNKFKFKKFSDRVAEVKIDVVHKIRRTTDDTEEYETYFQTAIIKWTSLNHTNDYKTFTAEIAGQSRTLVQLVHHQAKVVSIVLQHLSKPDSMAYEALLDLVVQLARDLQNDFYPHFQSVFDVLIVLLKANSRNVALLEMIFTCLSYLFKFLWRYMIKDISTVFSYYSPILDANNRPYIRKFAAESFGFLIRKVKDPDSVLDLVFDSFNHRSQYILGIGRLLFEVMKGVRHHLHSSAVTIFPMILSKIGPHPTSTEPSDATIFTKVRSCISHTMSAMSEHVSGTNNMDHLWPVLLSQIKARQVKWVETGDQFEPVSHLIQLLLVWLDFKHGALVSDADAVAEVVCSVLDCELNLPDLLLTKTLNCVSSLLQGRHDSLSAPVLTKLIDLSFSSRFPSSHVYPFAKVLFTESYFEQAVLSPLIGFIHHRMSDPAASDRIETLMFVTELISSKTISVYDASHLLQYTPYSMDFRLSKKRAKQQKYTFQRYLWELLSPEDLQDIKQLTLLWASLVCIPNIRCSNCDLTILQDVIDGLWQRVTTSVDTSPIKELQLSILHEATLCLYFCVRNKFFKWITFDKILSLLKCCSSSVRALQVVDLYFYLCRHQSEEDDAEGEQRHLTDEATCLTVFPLLEGNLSHYSHTIRLLSLQILSQFQLKLPYLEDPDLSQPGVFRICLDAEKCPPTVHEFRETLRHLQYLDAKLVHRNIPVASPRFLQVPLRYLIGNLFINFKPIWDPVHRLIASHAISMTRDSFWEVYGSQLDSCASVCEGSVPPPTVMTTFEIEESEEDDDEGAESSVHPDLLQLLMEQDSRPKSDFVQPDMEFFREHLWKIMLLFPDVCEASSKVLSPLLFRFVKNEYDQVDSETTALQNILCKEWRHSGGGGGGEEEEEMEVNEEDTDGGSDAEEEEEEEEQEEESGHCDDDGDGVENSGDDDDDGENTDDDDDDDDEEEEEEEEEVTLNSDNAEVEVNSDEDDDDDEAEEENSDEDDDVDSEEPNSREVSKITDEDGEENEAEEMEVKEDERAKKKKKRKKKDGDDDDDKGHDLSVTSNGGQKKQKQEPAVLKQLLLHFVLFSKFKHGGSLHLSHKLRDLYNKFLQHRDLKVQRMAFECLMTFPHKDITPYRENLVRILENKGFRAELARFNLDSNCCILKSEHRTSVFQVLSRILCGVLKNKKTPESKKGQVFTFFCGCGQVERVAFVEVVLKPFLDFLSEYSSLEHLKSSIDLTRVFPPALFQSFSTLIWLILRKLGHYLQDYLKNMLHTILGMIATVNACLKNKRKIYQRVVKTLVQASRPCYLRLYQFFTVFETYSYTPEDIDSVFDVVVWPKIETLPKDCVSSPTFLLKLLNIWSKNPRLFPLFLKSRPVDGASVCALTYIFQLLSSRRLSRTVSLLIVEMVLNFYNPELPDDDGLEFKLVAVNGAGEHSQDLKELGSDIMKPHFSSIVKYLKNYFTAVRRRIGMKKANSRELAILSHVSAHVTDGQLCSDLVRLLLPFLIKKIPRTTEMEIDLLNSILNLLTHVEKPPPVLFRQMTHLLFTINHEEPKKLLYDVILKLSQKDDNLKDIGEVLCGLNSWNPRRLEEIDYDRRLSAFNSASRLISKMKELDTDFIVPIIYNCCHFISTVEDFSIRNSSTQCLLTIVSKFPDSSQHSQVYQEIIGKTLLPKVKHGIRSSSQVICREYFTILRAIVVKFSDVKPFKDLVKLTSTDKDMDFFENMKNIKVQRRSRALRRLSASLESYQMSQEALTHYVLPLASSIIQAPHKQIEGIQERAIELLGSVCRLVQWRVYLQQLQFYVKRMVMPRNNKTHNQRLLVRVVVTILESFRFDLSSSSYESDQGRGPLGKYIEDKLGKSEENGVDDDDEEDDNNNNDEDLNNDDNADDDGDVVGDVEELTDVDYSVVKDNKGNVLNMLVCPEPMATTIHKTILKSIVPTLYKVLVKRVKSETEHKLAKKSAVEEFEIVRVPVALAIVKLLHVLPRDCLKSFLPKVILRICEFLRSRVLDIRKASRDTLTKISTVIGPRYLPCLVYELRSALSRGYQLHILGFTLHSVLNAMVGQMKTGDLNSCCKSLIEIFNEDIFGMVAEEKTVDAITSNFIEAQTCKSFYSYTLLARYISKSHVTQLIAPVKEILDTSSNQKTIKKVEKILQRILEGLLLNRDFGTKDLLIFIHSLVKETLPLLANTKQEKTKKDDSDLRPENCLLIPKAPRRDEKKAKVIKRTNFHVLAEFGLHLLYLTFRKSRLKSTIQEHLELLDPFVGILITSLESKHIPMVVFSLKSLNIMMKFPLPSIQRNIKSLASHLFVLLNSYGASGAARGKNAELIAVVFKSITTLVREIPYYKLPADHLQVLLLYCEEDIMDYTRQACAFNLIKAILHRKIVSDNIIELVSHIEKLAITSQLPFVQKQSRDVVLRFLLDYPLGKKLYDHLELLFQQLQYSQETGRLSAMELVLSLVHKYPVLQLNEDASLFFLPFCMSLANDDSAKCRKTAATTIKLLLQRLTPETCSDLFTNCIYWYSSKKLQLKMVAAQVCGLFAETEKADFKKRLQELLPLISTHTSTENFSNTSVSSEEQEQDRLLYHTLNSYLKIVRCCDILQDSKFAKLTNTIWGNVQDLMLYPHLWVQYVCGQLLGHLFSVWSPHKLAAAVFSGQRPTETQYLLIEGQKKIHTLVLNSIGQLQTTLLQKQQAEQAVKNLVFLAKVIKHLNLLQGILKVAAVGAGKGQEEEGEVEDSVMEEGEEEEEQEKKEVEEEDEEEVEGEKDEDSVTEDEDSEDEEEKEKEVDSVIGEGEDKDEEEEDDDDDDDDDDDESEEEEEEDAAEVFPAKRQEEKMDVVASDDDDEEEEDEEGEEDNEEEVEEEEEEEDKGPGEYRVSIPWITRKMIHEAHYENIHNPSCVLKRSYVFKWFAAVAIDLGAELLKDVIHIALPALHRELNNSRRMPDPALKTLTQEVLDLLKKTVGSAVFSEKFAEAQKIRMERIASRKQRKAVEAVTRPDITYKRKLKQNVAKVAAKKRKVEKIRTLKTLTGRFSKKRR
ncbi:small subunit processome component 20 homolog [Argonauta hians]